MNNSEQLKAALRAQLGPAAAGLDLDAVVAAALAGSAPAAPVPVAGADADGFCLLYQKRDGQYLSVHAPAPGGRPLGADELLDELKKKRLFNIDRGELDEQLARADGSARRISSFVDDCKNLGEAPSLKVAQDEMAVWLTVPQGLWPELLPTVTRQLREDERVVHGILERKLAALAALVREETAVFRNAVVARGTPPTRGVTARLRYEFDTHKGPVPLPLPDGRVSYYQLNLIKNVRKDQTLAIKYPAGLGEPGLTVRGQVVPPLRGRDVKLLPGQNVKTTADGLKFFAAASGHAHGDASVVSVDNIYTVAGDVDYATGNIDIDGTVVITGWVRTGFSVQAAGDIEILGGVEGATVVSRGGSIMVHGGVLGSGRARLEARYDITANHAESAWLSARRQVKIKDSLLHSLTLAGGSVQVFEKKGAIIGGIVRARGSILAKQVGGEGGARTELRIENSEGQALLDELELIDKKLAQLTVERRGTERMVAGRLGARAAENGEAERDMQDLVRFSDLETKIRMYETRRAELRRGLQLPARANIKVKDVVMPGTTVSFAGRQLVLNERHQYVTFYCREDEIRFLPFTE
ncbi:MAG TPA: FapA family protein [bacterium]|nr:FapA family protein [bacterium]